jgi:hypothetical protein
MICFGRVYIAKLFFGSYRALSENSWDYQKAAEIFKTLHAQAKIPQEAFAK